MLSCTNTTALRKPVTVSKYRTALLSLLSTVVALEKMKTSRSFPGTLTQPDRNTQNFGVRNAHMPRQRNPDRHQTDHRHSNSSSEENQPDEPTVFLLRRKETSILQNVHPT